MKYERLTNNNVEEYNPEYDFCIGCKHFGEPNGCNRPNGTCGNYERFIETYDRLAELEDKIENGTLVELSCKVGDTVYIATKHWDIKEVVEAKVERIEFYAIENKQDFTFYLDHKYIFSKTNPDMVKERYIFWKEEIFLTKAEAEQKLKELGEV